jgi:hypothetical protein
VWILAFFQVIMLKPNDKTLGKKENPHMTTLQEIDQIIKTNKVLPKNFLSLFGKKTLLNYLKNNNIDTYSDNTLQLLTFAKI